MIAFYSDTRDLRDRIERLLAGSELRSTDRRDEFQALLAEASVGIAGLRRCSAADVAWLRTVFVPGLAEPSCVVVTPLSLARLQRLRGIDSSRCHVVWAGELGGRLVRVLDHIEPWHHDPIRLLGQRLLRDRSLHWSVAKAVEQVCTLSDDSPSSPPPSSVVDLARKVDITPDALRRYWREEVPLGCGLKQLLSWALLMWGVRHRAHAKWEVIAGEAGVRRRTLERHSSGLAGCTLAEAVREPAQVKRRFREWVTEVSKVDRPAIPPPPVQHPGDSRMRPQHGGSSSIFGAAAARGLWAPLPGSRRRNTLPDYVAQAMSAGQ